MNKEALINVNGVVKTRAEWEAEYGRIPKLKQVEITTTAAPEIEESEDTKPKKKATKKKTVKKSKK